MENNLFGKLPAKGMRDFLPEECEKREKILDAIKKVYGSYGFVSIETPCVEDIRLLEGKNGGENEKLIFRILKRGEKLEESQNGELCDLGLRYDLTLPFTRYYANNSGTLPAVFKAMQTGYVWRADRPQKGRFRQFMQCDIDIIGEKSALAECELIAATAETLDVLGVKGFTVRINDRRILRHLAESAGFDEKTSRDVFIILDKSDKIGLDGVKKELSAIDPVSAEKLVSVMGALREGGTEALRAAFHADCPEATENIEKILDISRAGGVSCVFDISLIRGMDYYTGTIFEVGVDGLGYAVGGGGRYDKLVGKYIGKDIPACGFSIGFERIVSLLSEKGLKAEKPGGTAIVAERNDSEDILALMMKKQKEIRKTMRASVFYKAKNFRAQLDSFRAQGYDSVILIEEGGEREIPLVQI